MDAFDCITIVKCLVDIGKYTTDITGMNYGSLLHFVHYMQEILTMLTTLAASDSIKQRQCIKYAQNLGLDAQKTKAVRHVTPEKSGMMHWQVVMCVKNYHWLLFNCTFCLVFNKFHAYLHSNYQYFFYNPSQASMIADRVARKLCKCMQILTKFSRFYHVTPKTKWRGVNMTPTNLSVTPKIRPQCVNDSYKIFP